MNKGTLLEKFDNNDFIFIIMIIAGCLTFLGMWIAGLLICGCN